MNLYHYTNITMAESILASGLNNGHLTRASGAIERPVVWLTSDQSHEGHGLLTGVEKMTEGNRNYVERASGKRPKNDYVGNKTQIRIKVRVQQNDRCLTPYVKYCVDNGDSKIYAKMMGLSCYHSLRELSDIELLNLAKSFKTKEDTWYLYHGIISPNQIIAMDYNLDDRFVPYEFELHGRNQMIFDGVVPASQDATEQLQLLFDRGFQLDRISAVTLCATLDQAPMVMIRGCGMQLLVDVVREEFLRGSPPAKAEGVLRWIRDHKDELLQSYQLARERLSFYNSYSSPA